MRFASILFLFALCAIELHAQGPAIHFREIGKEAGVTKVPSARESALRRRDHLGWVALFDCDNRGKLDILVVNDSDDRASARGGVPVVTLYRQGENLKSQTSHRKRDSHGRAGDGIAGADYDNDDCRTYTSRLQRNVLYHNLGAASLRTSRRRRRTRWAFSSGGVGGLRPRRPSGFICVALRAYGHQSPAHCGKSIEEFLSQRLARGNPWTMDGESDFLFHNRGDGTFEEVSKKAGVTTPARIWTGAVWGDYDNQGWPSLLVANDTGPNFLYHNSATARLKKSHAERRWR